MIELLESIFWALKLYLPKGVHPLHMWCIIRNRPPIFGSFLSPFPYMWELATNLALLLLLLSSLLTLVDFHLTLGAQWVRLVALSQSHSVSAFDSLLYTQRLYTNNVTLNFVNSFFPSRIAEIFQTVPFSHPCSLIPSIPRIYFLQQQWYIKSVAFCSFYKTHFTYTYHLIPLLILNYRHSFL